MTPNLVLSTQGITLEVSVTATFTAEPLAETLQFWMHRLGLPVQLQFSPYHQVFQELTNPGSIARGSGRPGLSVFLIRLEDWARAQAREEKAVTILAAVDEFISCFQAFTAIAQRPSLIVVCPASPGAADSTDLGPVIERSYADLRAKLQDLRDVTLWLPNDVEADYGVERTYDPIADEESHLPFTAAGYTALATMIARRIRSVVQPPKKVIVVDADNTLWDGVVGEAGVQGIRFSSGRLVLHEFLRARKKQGVLLVLASKNEESLVAESFKHPDCLLTPLDFVSWKVNWDPKSQNILQTAEELELGLDSFVFLDDNPVECAEVDGHCPGVTVLNTPADAADVPSFLAHAWILDEAGATTVDEKRTDMYRQQRARKAFRNCATGFVDFIEGLELKVEIEAPREADYARCAQLSERTNQFNASGVRWKPSHFASMMNSGERMGLQVFARDRFGDYGMVGLVVYHPEGDVLRVENMLMSCRALGKGIEHQVIAALGPKAEAGGQQDILIQFLKTSRNLPAERFLRSLGGRETAEGFLLTTEQATAIRFDPGVLASSEIVSGEDHAEPRSRVPKVDYQNIATKLRSSEAIQRAVRQHLLRARPELKNPFVAPHDEREARLQAIWEETLHIAGIGVTDSFLELGGESLHAASISSRIVKEFGVRVPLDLILASQTIQELCQRVAVAPMARSAVLNRDVTPALSPAQQRLWFLDEFVDNPAAYNVPVARRILGPLDLAILKGALESVARRHEPLRYTFVIGGTLQVAADPGVEMEVIDLSFRSLDALVHREASKRFDLKRGPLLRCAVIRVASEDHVVVLTAHHTISDGWSMRILLRELGQAYVALKGLRQPLWKPLEATYAAYAEWQKGWLISAEAKAEIEYWKKALDGAPLLLELASDKPRPQVMGHWGGALFETLSPDVRRSVEQLAQTLGCTSFAVLLAAWQVLLYRYSRQEDIVVGMPVAGRSWPDIEPLVGCFVNTLAIRSQLDASVAFRDHVKATARTLGEALSHQELPFETLVNELGLKRNPSCSPLFQTMFVAQNMPAGDLEAPGLVVEHVPVHNGGAKFDLLCEVTPRESGYDVMLEYNAGLFEEETAVAMLRHYAILLVNGCETPEAKLDSLPMMSPGELQEVLSVAQGDTSFAPPETTLMALFEEQCARQPDAIAITFESSSWTYGELNQKANQLAHRLRRMGVRPNELVGVFAERSLEMVVALYGILKAGGTYVPIDPEYPPSRVAFLLQDSAPSMLLVQERLAAQLPVTSARLLRLDADWADIERESTDDLEPMATPDDAAYMIYTSGSTGQPKGVLNSHRAICNRLVWMQNQYHLSETDAVLQKTPFSFDVSVWEFFWPLQVGARMVIARPGGHRDPAYLIETITKERITALHFVPSMLGAFLADPDAGNCQGLRQVFCSGEALSHSMQEQFFAALPSQLHNLYGPTEAAVDVTHWTCVAGDGRSSVPIGRPVSNTQIYILDVAGRVVPMGVAGELYIGGVQVGMGYHHRPKLTAERFLPDHISGQPRARLYRTGDLARYRRSGEVEYLGRIDHQVKIRGFRIELGEVEAALLKQPGVREAVVVAREDTPGVKRLVAYISGVGPDCQQLREELKKTLPEYMVPSVVLLLERLPLTPNGKIDRRSLPVPPERNEAHVQYVRPRTEMELRLARLWAGVLRLETVGVHDNFFELGGDSILSIQLVSRARRDGLKLTSAMLFSYQTIAELAAVTVPAEVGAGRGTAAEGSLPLTPIQKWFFEQQLAEPHHFNQAFLFTVSAPMSRTVLEQVVHALERHHESLRLRFSHNGSEWTQVYGPISDRVANLDCITLTALSKEEASKAVEDASRKVQGELDIEKGPLWRVVHFDLGPDNPGRLLVVAHHLCIDGISWKVLIEDLESAYLQAGQGKDVHLLPGTDSFKVWASRLESYASNEVLWRELPMWQSHAMPARGAEALGAWGLDGGSANLEKDASTVTVSLSAAETQHLLQRVPAAYATQINDVLLTALSRAWAVWTAGKPLWIDLEGHGRESLFEDVDVSRTVGWFTSILPVWLGEASAAIHWNPGEDLKAVKEQLRGIPNHGIGYGILRYLSVAADIQSPLRPAIVFNYLGQIDALVQDSSLLQFAGESEGPWHSSEQQRRYAIEINCLIVREQLEFRCTYGKKLHTRSQIESFVAGFAKALHQLIEHCLLPATGCRTPSDYPLACVEQADLDRLGVGRDCEDLYPLTPIQTLFLSADSGAIFDQWRATLSGELNAELFRRAWEQMLELHPILRSSIHTEALKEPLQMVHRRVNPQWTIEDWRAVPRQELDARWRMFLDQDRRRPAQLAGAPLMRFTLVRAEDQVWRFVWSVSPLLLDGWSWPTVFSGVNQLYDCMARGTQPQLAPARPYRDYVKWVRNCKGGEAQEFWSSVMAGIDRPTALPLEPQTVADGDRFVCVKVTVPGDTLLRLLDAARQNHVTLNSMVQAAWALLIRKQSGEQDIIFGSAFSGRPADLPEAETIVGPFTNNVPVRVAVDDSLLMDDFVRRVHERLLEVSLHQFMPMVEIQAATSVPWRYRLFDSLVVFQNYLVDDSARRFGTDVTISEFVGPVHTNFPLLLLVEPRAGLDMSLYYDRRSISAATAELWANDINVALLALLRLSKLNVAEAIAQLSPRLQPNALKTKRPRPQASEMLPPQNDMETAIAAQWCDLFGLERIGTDENFFDLGGHSLLLVQMHARLKRTLGIDLPVITLLEYPSIRTLARYLNQHSSAEANKSDLARQRAQKQREAFARVRTVLKR